MTEQECATKLAAAGITADVICPVSIGFLIVTDNDYLQEDYTGTEFQFKSAYCTEMELGKAVFDECQTALDKAAVENPDAFDDSDWLQMVNVFLAVPN